MIKKFKDELIQRYVDFLYEGRIVYDYINDVINNKPIDIEYLKGCWSYEELFEKKTVIIDLVNEFCLTHNVKNFIKTGFMLTVMFHSSYWDKNKISCYMDLYNKAINEKFFLNDIVLLFFHREYENNIKYFNILLEKVGIDKYKIKIN